MNVNECGIVKMREREKRDNFMHHDIDKYRNIIRGREKERLRDRETDRQREKDIEIP